MALDWMHGTFSVAVMDWLQSDASQAASGKEVDGMKDEALL